LEWAAGEARLRGVPLRIVHALPFSVPRGTEPDPSVEGAKAQVQGLAAQAQLLDERPLTVTAEVLDGLPAQALVDESRSSALLVIGTRGHGALTRVMLGSTAVDVTARAMCPVAVIPAGADVTATSGPVVVGVDDSAANDQALGFAFDRAARRNAGVVAVHVHDESEAPGAQGAAAVLENAIRPWRVRYPGVAVTEQVVSGAVVAELARALSTHGDVLVVGARGRSVLAGAVLGSVSQRLLHEAPGPVVIVRC
jgi:nucleotide-binding universal stress UspA family protein